MSEPHKIEFSDLVVDEHDEAVAWKPRWTRRGFLFLGGIGIVTVATNGLQAFAFSAAVAPEKRAELMGTIGLYGSDVDGAKRLLYSWPVDVKNGLNEYRVRADAKDVAVGGPAWITEGQFELPTTGRIYRIASRVDCRLIEPVVGNTLTICWPITTDLASL